MNTKNEIEAYINSQQKQKQNDMRSLHQIILDLAPGCKLWFLDGKDSSNKTVSNPNIGYGTCTLSYTNGTTKEFYQVGVSANTAGISVYIFGIDDKTYLAKTFGNEIGKASVTGYCIKFKKLEDINMPVLKAAIAYGLNSTPEQN